MELKINLVEYNKWKHQNDADDMNSYNGCVFRYAERWAELMEEQIEDDDTEIVIFNKLVHCVTNMSHDANTENITGNQHSMARGVIRRCWKYGDLFGQVCRFLDWKTVYDWSNIHEIIDESIHDIEEEEKQ